MKSRVEERDPAEAQCSVHEGLHKLVQLLPQITRGLRRRAAPADFNDSVLGRRHSALVALLRENGPRTAGSLADECGITLATVSGLVAELERAGFVQRTTDPADRRRTIVSLLAGRDDAINQWLGGVTAPILRALDKLSPEERAAFVKALEVLEAELNRGPEGERHDARSSGVNGRGRSDTERQHITRSSR
ncbi:MAG: MarR family winged helix-turn-helix transcriptional regulator [Acidimicrobiales bacterium]